jgi:hypothetical protein
MSFLQFSPAKFCMHSLFAQTLPSHLPWFHHPNNNWSVVKVKVKCTLVQALRLVQTVWPIEGVKVQLYPFLTTALEGGEGSASRPGRSLPPEKSWYPLYRRLCGYQDRSGQVLMSCIQHKTPKYAFFFWLLLLPLFNLL